MAGTQIFYTKLTLIGVPIILIQLKNAKKFCCKELNNK